jgi:hypothetical protein
MSGFQPLWCNHWNVLLFPFYVIWKFFGMWTGTSSLTQFTSPVHPLLNSVLYCIITMENALTLHIPFLFGTSLVVVARRQL